MENGKISVIIPVWHPNIDQLKKCLNSVIKQTYVNLEIILIYRKSEGFDDKFYHLINEYHEEKRLKVIEGKSKGFVNALNEGILNSNGEFIGRLDADDYCKIERFEKQLEFKKIHNYNIVGTWAYSISEDGKIIGKIEPPTSHFDIRKKMMFHCPLLHPTILMDRKMLDDIGLYDPSFIHAEDYELYFRAMSRNYKFGNVPDHLGYIRETIESRSRGAEWRKQRLYYIKAKNKAFFHYGFVKPYDIIYHILTPVSYFMSPFIWNRLKKFTGWNK